MRDFGNSTRNYGNTSEHPNSARNASTKYLRDLQCVGRVCYQHNQTFQNFVSQNGWDGTGHLNIRDLDKSQLYGIIRSMPKGAVLHAHFPAMVNWALLLTTLLKHHVFRQQLYYLSNVDALHAYDIAYEVWNTPSRD